MTTDERIAELERRVDQSLDVGGTTRAIAYELRALRLMLRDEIREAAWRLQAPGTPVVLSESAVQAYASLEDKP